MRALNWPAAWLHLAFRDCVTLELAISEQSLSGAARVLGESKATVSRRLSTLEHRLGARLLIRSPRGIEPTIEGSGLAREGRVLADRLATALSLAAHDWKSDAGVVKLGILGAVRIDWLTKLLLEFSIASPGIRVEVVRLSGVKEITATVDMAVMTGPLPNGPYTCSKIHRYKQSLFAARSYLDARGQPSALQDLFDHPIIVVSPHPEPLHAIDGSGGRITVSPTFSPGDIGLAEELVANGAGIGLLPKRGGARAYREDGLVEIAGTWAFPTISTYLVSPEAPVEPMRTRLLKHFLQSRGRGLSTTKELAC